MPNLDKNKCAIPQARQQQCAVESLIICGGFWYAQSGKQLR